MLPDKFIPGEYYWVRTKANNFWHVCRCYHGFIPDEYTHFEIMGEESAFYTVADIVAAIHIERPKTEGSENDTN